MAAGANWTFDQERAPVFEAVYRDLQAYARYDLDRSPLTPDRSRLRRALGVVEVLWGSQCALAAVLYRFKVWGRRHRLPLLPRLADKLNQALFRVYIGDRVEIGAGLYINHGQVAIDGLVRIGEECTVSPFVTIGLSNSVRNWGSLGQGPWIGDGVHIGTGARILGPVRVGHGVRVGANAVVITDVPDRCTAVGVPARVLAPAEERYPPPDVGVLPAPASR